MLGGGLYRNPTPSYGSHRLSTPPEGALGKRAGLLAWGYRLHA